VVLGVGEFNSQFGEGGEDIGLDFNEFGSHGSLVGVDQVFSGFLQKSDDGGLSLESVLGELVPLGSVGFDQVGQGFVVVSFFGGSVDELLVLVDGVSVSSLVSADGEFVSLVVVDVLLEKLDVSFAVLFGSGDSLFLSVFTLVGVLLGGGEEFNDFSSLEVGSSGVELEIDGVKDVSSFFGLIHQLEKILLACKSRGSEQEN